VKTNRRDLNAPIPGMSLTTEPGNRPWEKPPRITSVDEAIDFYVEKLTDPKTSSMIMDKVEDGMPITLMVDMFQTGAVAKGIHSIDVGVLIAPVAIELIKAMAEDMDVEYTIGTEADARTDSKDEDITSDVVRKLLSDSGEDEMPMDMEEEEQQQETDIAEPKRGLMARAEHMETEEDGV